MAESLSIRPQTMKDSHQFCESPTDFCDTSSQGNRDDFLDRDPGYIEDRFRVDRKKLEQMLQGHMEHDDEGAEEFFQRIMDETNTQITWPSKLKIGAKSKKDPHIKVIGYPGDVSAAKEKIMTVLDTKGNRVTLKMDVSHTDHSHVIGKGGNNIKRVMQETCCHIHFPDSNRGSTIQEKSNQVSIAGQPLGVECARVQIRELLPLVFIFELPVTGVLQPLPDTSSPFIQQLQQQYSISISLRQRPRMYVTTVTVRGSVCNAKGVKEGTGRLMEHLLSNTGQGTLPVSMQLEIAPQHHLFIIGRGGMNIKQIMQRTGASIHFPDPSTVTPQRKGAVYLTGSIESVFLARHQLIGCLPLVLMFDVKEEIEMDQSRIAQLMEQLDVFISVKPKPKQPSKSVIVKSIERNAANMYLARLMLLGVEKDHSIFNPSSGNVSPSNQKLPSCNGLGLSALGLFGQTMLSVNTANSLMMLNGSRSPSSVPSPHNSPSSTSPNQWMSPPPGIYAPMMVLGPNTTCTVHSHHDLLSHCNGLQKDLDTSLFMRVPPQLDQDVRTNMNGCSSTPGSPSSSPLHSVKSSSAVDLTDLPMMHKFGDIVTRDLTLSSSGHTLDLLGLSKTTDAPSKSQSLFLNNSMGRSLENSLGHLSLQNGEKGTDGGVECSISDKLAPGIERKNSTSSLFGPFDFDYEQKKLLATKAMQKKPVGESRIPTDFWSGMGFSKSMPESAIREKLGQHGLYCGPNIPQPYEEIPPDLSPDVDRDPWRDTSQPVNKPMNPAPGEYPSPRKRYEYGLSSSNHVDSASLPPSKSYWSAKTDLAELFSKLGLGKYTDLFQQQEIDLATFRTLTDQDLRELGISTFGARRKMLLAITDLNKRRTLMSIQTGTNLPFQENGGSVLSHSQTNMASLSGRW